MPKPVRARYARIESLVETLLKDARIEAPPVKVEDFIRSCGIRLVKADLGETSGLFLRSSDDLLIGVNSKHAEVRKRFTMAHEFGHYLLHVDIDAHYDKSFIPRFRSEESSQATNIEEIEANFFAANLLMPRAFLFTDRAMLSMDSDSEVGVLAKRYKVSQHAMSLRIFNLFGDHMLF